MIHLLYLLALGATLSLGVSTSLSAQVLLQGRVADEETGEAIAGARVLLLDERGRHVDALLAGEDGSFEFFIKRHGPYQLRASRIGYQENTSPRLWLGEHSIVQVELRLHVNAILLAPLEVVARSPARRSAVLDNFYARLHSGMGTFITREEIERLRPALVTDVLATVPGIRLETSGAGHRRVVYLGRAIAAAGPCPAQIFVDGFLVNRPLRSPTATPASTLTVDDVVSPGSIEGIEVYNGLSSVPAEFLNPDSRCGVVAIWTRRGGA